MDYIALAKAILENIGGNENVKSVVHCATRLRINLKDTSKYFCDNFLFIYFSL